MALTFTKFPTPDLYVRAGRGDVVEWVGTITFDNSYTTNGKAVAASDFGLDSILFLSLNAATNIVTKFVQWDQVNSKIKVLIEDAISGICAEAANASDQSLIIIPVRVLGRLKSA